MPNSALKRRKKLHFSKKKILKRITHVYFHTLEKIVFNPKLAFSVSICIICYFRNTVHIKIVQIMHRSYKLILKKNVKK